MPELHKNQIEWSAPEPKKVSLDKPDYSPLANALNGLSKAANEFSVYKAHIDDVDANEKMKLATADALAELNKEEPSDNNYTNALNKFNASLKTQFDSFDEATRNRFMRDNPTFFGEQDLKAREVVFDKQQKFAITKAKNVIPLLASNVTEGIESYDSQRKILDGMVANMDNVTAEEMINSFDRYVQIGNLENMIRNGMYSDAVTFLENPKESDKFTPEERLNYKVTIQNMINNDAETSEKLRKQALKDMQDGLEKSLTSTLLYLYDRRDNSYARAIHALDDPNKEIELYDESGNVVGKISAKNIPVDVRREAIKNSREYRKDSMSYKTNAFNAKTLANNLETLYKQNKNKRPTGEVFNNIYNFTQSDDFYYLDDDAQGKMLSIVYGEVNRYNEQVIPYGALRDQRLLYGGIEETSAPSGPAKVREYVFGKQKLSDTDFDKLPPKIKEAYKAGSTALSLAPDILWGHPVSAVKKLTVPSWTEDQRVGYDELTANLKEQYRKSSDKKVKDGSELEFLMNTYASLLAYNQDERKNVGLQFATDEQIGLTYARMLGLMEQTGQTDVLIGQNMSKEDAEKIRKGIFDSFYELMYNGGKQSLTKEQVEYKNKFYDSLVEGSYGFGGTVFEPNAPKSSDAKRVYSNTLTEAYNKQLKKENK